MQLTRSGAVDPAAMLTQRQLFSEGLEAYQSFEHLTEGWVKVELSFDGTHETRTADGQVSGG